MREVKVKAAAPAALRRKVRRPARSIACSSLGMTANHGNAAEAGRGEKPTRTISKKLGVGLGTVHRIAQRRSKNLCGDFSNGSLEVSVPEQLTKLQIVAGRGDR